jgi:RNA polymerase sigma-70 factor (ECF subfamily)
VESGSPKDVTALLQAWEGGDRAALDRLIPVVYEELRRIARRRMRGEGHAPTLQTTALVNEAYLRLIDVRQVRWQDRAHFFAVAAEMMRRTLVEAARRRRRQKRGGGAVRVSLNESMDPAAGRAGELIALDDALQALAAFDPRKARVVELRFFGGLSVEETAEVLRISPQSVMRDWKLARAWLTAELAGTQ